MTHDDIAFEQATMPTTQFPDALEVMIAGARYHLCLLLSATRLARVGEQTLNIPSGQAFARKSKSFSINFLA
jgi:hypothetical protein